MIITIEGKRQSGKTSAARNLVKGYNAVFLCPSALKSSFSFLGVNKDTDFIVIELTKFDSLDHIKSLFKRGTGLKSFDIPTPNVILIVNN